MTEIICKALGSLSERKGWFYIAPAVLAIVVGCYTYFSNNQLNVFVDVIGSIGIFSALMFSVIFIVVEHFLKRKETFNTENEEDKRYLKNYQDFTRNTVTRISYSIFHAGLVIILAFVLPLINCDKIWWLTVRNSFFSFLLLQYIALIIIVVIDMYAMLIDDTESKR